MAKRVLVVCSSGMSTSMLVRSIKKAADEEGYPIDVVASGVAGIEEDMKSSDAVLVGPQIRHRYDNLKKMANESGIPIEMIPPGIYGLMDGKAALKLIKKMIEV